MPIGDIFALAGFAGLVILFIGMISANVAVFRMQRALNKDCNAEDRVSPWFVIGKGSAVNKPASKYLDKFGNGPLNRDLRISYWLCGIGGTIGIGSTLIVKVLFR